jgi:hypothetical protein
MYLSPSMLFRSSFSIRLQLACVVAAACVCLACSGEPRDAGDEPSAEAQAPTPPTPQQTRATHDSSAIAGFLREFNYTVVSFLAEEERYYAALAADTTSAERYLLFMRVQSDSVAFLLDPIGLGWAGPPRVTSWVRLRGAEIDGVLISFDDIVEASVATLVYELSDDHLTRIYTDHRVCRPAELRDLDIDGVPELVSYVEDPLNGRDCARSCYLALLSKFDVLPAWVRIQRWDGETWIPVEREFPAFYHELADTLQTIDRWLRGGPGADWCPYDSWLRGERRDHFARLAKRALEVATSGQDTPP